MTDYPLPVSMTERLRNMKKGANDFFETKQETIFRLTARIREDNPRRKFKTQTCTEKGVEGTRVWRTR